MCKMFGVDIGNSDIKIVYGTDCLSIKNIIAPGRERRIFEQETGEPIDYLDVTIESKGEGLGRYFVGDLALKEGGQYIREKHMGSIKTLNNDTYVLLLAAIAYKLFDPAVPEKTEYINLGTGLPTEEYYLGGMIEKFIQRIKGTHKVKFNHPMYREAEITIIIKEVFTIPEGAAAMINQMYDENGGIIEEKTDLRNRLNIVIDIGALTTDVSAIENNQSIGTLCFGIKKGIYHALDEIIEDISQRHNGYVLSRHKLVQYLTQEGGNIPYKKQTIDANIYAKYRYEQLAEDISRKVVNKLNREKPNIQDEVYTTFIVGGGALALSEYLPKFLKDYQLEFSEDPIYANAKGYYKVAQSFMEKT